VVRVLECSVAKLIVTPEELGKLLTAVVKVVVSSDSGEDEVVVSIH